MIRDPWKNTQVVPRSWDLSSTEGEADWGASFDHPGWSHTPNTAVITGFRRSGDNNLFNLEAAKIRDFQFAEHECRDIFMNSFDHAHSWYTCPDGFFLSSLRRGLPADCNHLGCIDEAKCCRPKGAGRWGLCQVQDWWQSMSSEGSSTCPFPKAVAGLYRSDVSDLRGIGQAYCCELGVPTSDLVFETSTVSTDLFFVGRFQLQFFALVLAESPES